MLIQFSVSNYMSLKDETTLSLVAGQGKELKDNLRQYKDGHLLPTIAIFLPFKLTALFFIFKER